MRKLTAITELRQHIPKTGLSLEKYHIAKQLIGLGHVSLWSFDVSECGPGGGAVIPLESPMVKVNPNYPFLPKANARLEAGQFFSFVLANGKFASVRVLAQCWKYQPGRRVLFLAGLMDWSGNSRATAADIAGRPVLDYAWAHVGILAHYGATIDGFRALEADDIVPDTDRQRAYGPEVLRNMANERFAGVAKASSSLDAFEYQRIGWTLIKDYQIAPGEREYVLEWQREGSPQSVNWEERYWRFK